MSSHGGPGSAPIATRSRGRRYHWADLVLVLAVGDIAAIALSMLAAILLWAVLPTDFTPAPTLPYWLAGSVAAWLIAMRLLGGYDILSPAFRRASASVTLQALVVILIGTGLVFFFLPFVFPRGVGLVAPLFAAAGLLGWRASYGRFVRRAALGRRVAMLGTDDSCRRVASLLTESRSGIAHLPVAFIATADSTERTIGGLPVLRLSGDLWKIVEEHRIDEIIVGTQEHLADLGQIVLVECVSRGVAATPAIALYEALTGRVLASSLGASWFTQIPTDPRRPYLRLRRVMDVLLVLVVAPIAVALGLVVAALVIVDSGPPVLFRQTRVGQRGTHFLMHKFRTMGAQAEADGARFATEGDPRRTRVGRFLRRSRLDELPQLWDVLRGSMTLIGPRPERREFVDRLRGKLPVYEARLLLRPGVTGWAQVRLPYAGDLEESLTKLEYDLYYVKHVSPLLDLSIAIRTLAIMLRFAGR